MRSYLPLLLVLLTINSWSQSRWNAEFRPSMSFATEKVSGEKLRPGFGADAVLAYKVMPHLSAKGGFGIQSFSSQENSKEQGRNKINETSFSFGFELRLPITEKPLTYFLYAGGVLGEIAVENTLLSIEERSGYGLGAEVGLGLEYWLDDSWSIKPQIRYRSLSNKVTVADQQTEVDLRYLAISAALSLAF